LHHSSTHLLHLPANLFLDAEVAGALYRSKKLAELALLGFGQVDALALDLELFGEQLLDATRVSRVLFQHFIPQRAASHHLAPVHFTSLNIEALIYLAQLTHPLVGQPKLSLEQSRQAHLKAPLELLSIHAPFTLSIHAPATLTSALRVAHR
jgi:hypothetical protein